MEEVKLYKNKNWLIEQYLTLNKSALQIARDNNYNPGTIVRWLERQNIPIKRQWNKSKAKVFEMNDELQEIVDGLLLGDGFIYSLSTISGVLGISQKEDRISWIKCIQNELKKYNISSSFYFRKSKSHLIPVVVNNVILHTQSYGNFKEQYIRWYPNGKKAVPKDIQITDKILALWYMGDGSISIGSFNKNRRKYFNIIFYTNSFSKQDVIFLKDSLRDKYGYLPNIIKTNKNCFLIALKHQNDIIDFLQRTVRYKIDCFDYKWKMLNYLFLQGNVKIINNWTEKEIKILKKKYFLYGRDIPELVKRHSVSSIQHKSTEYNLSIKYRRPTIDRTRKKWLMQEIEILINLYPISNLDLINKRLRRSTSSIYHKASRLHLNRLN